MTPDHIAAAGFSLLMLSFSVLCVALARCIWRDK